MIFSSADGKVYALDHRKGKLIWTYTTKGEQQYNAWDYYLSSQDKLYVGTSDTHQFYSIGSTYGDIKWTLPLNMRVSGAASIMNKELVFGCFNGRIYFVDTESGKINASFQTEESKKHYAALFDEKDKVRKDIDPDGKNYLSSLPLP